MSPSDFFSQRLFTPVEGERRAAAHENMARDAVNLIVVDTVGAGNTSPTAPFLFDMPHTAEPSVSFGIGCLANPDPTTYCDPEGCATVRRWTMDERGLFIGVWLSLSTRVYTLGGMQAWPEGVRTRFWVRFHEIAIKDLGSAAETDAGSLEPRVVNF